MPSLAHPMTSGWVLHASSKHNSNLTARRRCGSRLRICTLQQQHRPVLLLQCAVGFKLKHKYSGPTTASLLKAAMETQWEEQQKSNHATELGSAQMDQRQLKRKAHRKETDSKRSKLAEQSASQVLQRGAIDGLTNTQARACLRRMQVTYPNSKVVIRKEKNELHRMFDLFQWSKWPPQNSE